VQETKTALGGMNCEEMVTVCLMSVL